MSEHNPTESANDDDKVDDAVDPRVQVIKKIIILRIL